LRATGTAPADDDADGGASWDLGSRDALETGWGDAFVDFASSQATLENSVNASRAGSQAMGKDVAFMRCILHAAVRELHGGIS
jgi:hypothetical protein